MDFKNKNDDGILEKLVHINRITKVVKGGRRFGFSALVVVGNQAGKIGIAHAKAKQVPDAIKKANETARRKLIHIPLREGRTIHHDVYGKDGAGKIILRSAPYSLRMQKFLLEQQRYDFLLEILLKYRLSLNQLHLNQQQLLSLIRLHQVR